MKVADFTANPKEHSPTELGVLLINRMYLANLEQARIEIHSLEPWERKRPPGWGAGFWFEYLGKKWFCLRTEYAGPNCELVMRWVIGWSPDSYGTQRIDIDHITSYGPQVR